MAPPIASSQSSAAAGCSVRVAVRVRPLLSFEKTERLGECVGCIPNSTQLYIGDGSGGGAGENGRNTFTFDFTFPKHCEQRTLYDDCVASLLEAFFEGFNATILAYGQTGSGKTYTMGSASSLRIAEEEQGIIPRVITGMYDLLREASEERPHVSYTVRCQFLEIYGEDIHDLLEPAGSSVTIREGQNGEVNVHGAKEMLVHGAEEMAMLLERGSLCRTTGSTLMNAHSSRSHAIFTVLLEQRIRPEGEAPDPEGKKVDADDVEIRRSKFHFVDLAGSERAKRTGASGQRFKEGVEINKGLLTLGNVISALGDDTKRGKVHVPYRDSKLTRMLQDSLGGNSQTLMICCVSPAESNMHETLSALRYANRARNIQNKPVVNRDANSMVISELREKVQALAAELLRIRSGGGAGGDEGEGGESHMSATTLRELAVASTPSRQTPMLLARASSMRTGSVDLPAPVQRELTLLRARAAEAEGEVQRLTEDSKLSRKRESEKDDLLAGIKAELDLAHAEIMERRAGGGGAGAEGVSTDELMLQIATAAGGSEPTCGDHNSEGDVKGASKERRGYLNDGNGNASPRPYLGMIKGFFSGSGSVRSPKSLDGTADGLNNAPSTSPAGSSSGRAAATGESNGHGARAKALAVVKSFHGRIQALEDRLQDSERQRAALERQLVHQSGSAGGAGGAGGGVGVSVGLSGGLAAAAGAIVNGNDAVAEAQRRIAEEKQRRQQLLASLDSSGEDGGDASGRSTGRSNRAADGSSQAKGAGSASSRDGVDNDEGHSDDDEEEDEEDEDLEDDERSAGNLRRLSLASSVITAAEEEERALRKSETRINAELLDLDKSIVLKEALLAQIKEGQASFETMQQHYEHKLKEMDEEVRRHEQEHERLLADLEALEKRTEVAVQEEREKLKKQLKEKTAALQKAKARQSELSVLSRDSSKKEDTVRGLESEIVRMKKIKVELQRRLDREQKRQRELLMEKSKEIMTLKRRATKDQAEVKRLERAKGKAEAISKRHMDELALIRRLQRQKLGVGRKQKLTAQERETKKLLDAKVKELTRREEAAERLAAEYEKKLLLLQQKESLELVKVSITSRRDQRQRSNRDAARSRVSPPFGSRSESIRSENRSENRSAGPLSPRLPSRTAIKQHSPQQQQQQQQVGASATVAVGAEVEGAGLFATPPPSLSFMDSEMILRAALPAEVGLDEEELETLREVEERLESNKAQLEYKDRKIVSIQQEVEAWAERRRQRRRGAGGAAGGHGQRQSGQGQAQGSGEQGKNGVEVGEALMIEELESDVNDLKGARGTIRVLFSSLVAARRGQKQKAGAARELQERLEEKTIALEDTQERLHAEQRSYDRKLTSIKAEYERNLNGLINHTGMSHLLQAAIDRTGGPTSGGGEDGGGGGQFSAAGGVVEKSSAGGGVGIDTTQDAMAKVLHERWLSEREKAKALEARLSEAEARMEDMDEVRKNERKAFSEKQQDVEWLSYELRAYRARCGQLRDERDRHATLSQQLQIEADGLRRRINASSHGAANHPRYPSSSSSSSTNNSFHHNAPSSNTHIHNNPPPVHGGGHPPPPSFSASPSSIRPPSPPTRSTTSGRLSSPNHGAAGAGVGTASGASPSRKPEPQVEQGTAGWVSERDSPIPAMRDGVGSGDRGRGSPVGRRVGATALLSPDNPSSDVGSDFDDADYADEHESLGGEEVDFAGVTSDIEAIREGRMPESMQLVARLNAEAGGKLSVFDRLASTTTESRRQKVNDRDQLHENLRRKAKQDALRKRKDFKVVPGPAAGLANGQPPGLGGLGSTTSTLSGSSGWGSVSVAEAIASLEKNAAGSGEGHDSARALSSISLREGATRPSGRGSLDDTGAAAAAIGGGSHHRSAFEPAKELSVFERLQARSRRRSSTGDQLTPSRPAPAKRARSPSYFQQQVHDTATKRHRTSNPNPHLKHNKTGRSTEAPTNHSKTGGVGHKKYVKMGGGNATLLAARLQAEAELSRMSGNSNSGSPPRAIAAQSGAEDLQANSTSSRERASDEGLEAVDDVSEVSAGRRDRRHVTTRSDRDSAPHAPHGRGSYSGAGTSSSNTTTGSSAGDVFDRLRNKLTESEQRRQAEAMAASGRQYPFTSRRASQDREAVALAAQQHTASSTSATHHGHQSSAAAGAGSNA